ncbi:MAG: hypothetical protein IPM98_01945 [Lewinellaceae bacterium]|nr:hypothetical protein [Lewinellaceae bacterium]
MRYPGSPRSSRSPQASTTASASAAEKATTTAAMPALSSRENQVSGAAKTEAQCAVVNPDDSPPTNPKLYASAYPSPAASGSSVHARKTAMPIRFRFLEASKRLRMVCYCSITFFRKSS